MSKIYLIRSQMILEVELIKQTPEQLRIENKNATVIWKPEPETKKYTFVPYLSTRLQRHREKYFTTIPEAVAYLIEETKKTLERLVANMHNSQLQLAALVAFAETVKEEEKTNDA